MSLKDYFIINPNGDTPAQTESDPKQIKQKPSSKSENVFPSSTKFNSEPMFSGSEPAFPINQSSNQEPAHTQTTQVNPFLDKILDVYDRGFEKLNQPGYDFFEYYKAVVKAGINNSQVYVMALDMAQAMDPNVSKDSLMRQADYYVAELEKVYNDFNSNGRNKIQELSQKKNNESNSLSSDISALNQQLQQIQTQIQQKQAALSDIDKRYQPEIDEITQKLGANDMVKNKFVTNIKVVQMNINNNLK